jgi:hypothetical protein
MELEKKLDEMSAALVQIKIDLAEYNALLSEHMRRTEAAEMRISRAEDRIDLKADRSYITWAIGISSTLIGGLVLLSNLLR